MKRSTLLKTLGLSFVALFTPPARATLAQAPVVPEEKLDPFDAVKAVFDGFDSVETSDISEFDTERNYSSGDRTKISFKLLYNPDDHHWNTWLVLEESLSEAEDFKREQRVLRISKILSVPLVNDPQDEKVRVSQDYHTNATCIVSIAKSIVLGKSVHEFESGALYCNCLNQNIIQNLRLKALSRFFELSQSARPEGSGAFSLT